MNNNFIITEDWLINNFNNLLNENNDLRAVVNSSDFEYIELSEDNVNALDIKHTIMTNDVYYRPLNYEHCDYILVGLECYDCGDTIVWLMRRDFFTSEFESNTQYQSLNNAVLTWIYWNVNSDNDIVCSRCLENNYFICASCNEYEPNDNSYYTDDTNECYCYDCSHDLYTCCECGHYFENTRDIRRCVDSRGNDEYICDDCFEHTEDYHYCYDCDTLYHVDNMVYNELLEVYLCEDCNDNHDDDCECVEHTHTTTNDDSSSNGLEPFTTEHFENYYNRCGGEGRIDAWHGYSRDFNFKHINDDDKNDIYFGVELEVENKGRYNTRCVASYVREYLDVIVASDGSLSNGFEMISDPHTMPKWSTKETKELWRKALSFLSSIGFVSHESNNCGLHIHATRSKLGNDTGDQKDTIARIDLILETFKQPLQTFARRSNNSYASFLSDCTREKDLAINTDKIKMVQSAEKYRALNIGHTDTVEFRLFRGTLKFDTFMASIQMVNNIIELAKNDKEYINKSFSYLTKLNGFKELKETIKNMNIIFTPRIKDHTLKLRLKELAKIRQVEAKVVRDKELRTSIYDYFVAYAELLIDLKNYVNFIETATPSDYWLKLKKEECKYATFKDAQKRYEDLVAYMRYDYREESYTYIDFDTGERRFRTYYTKESKKRIKELFKELKKAIKEVNNFIKKGGCLICV